MSIETENSTPLVSKRYIRRNEMGKPKHKRNDSELCSNHRNLLKTAVAEKRKWVNWAKTHQKEIKENTEKLLRNSRKYGEYYNLYN